MADLVPAWMWRPPGDIIEGLLAVSERQTRRTVVEVPRETMREAERCPRDRYYTMARRAQIRASMRGVTR